MKVTFFSNFLNHHQLPFCLEMYRSLGDDFRFISTEKITQERLLMGYTDMSEMYEFSLNSYSSADNYDNAMKLGYESDVVIIGTAPELFVLKRIHENKLTFRYSERLFKKGLWRFFWPKSIFSLLNYHTKYSKRNLYLLCASAYTANDMRIIKAYQNKMFKWGYFPECKIYNIEELMLRKQNDIPRILWVGRFLEIKHPEFAIQAAKTLMDQDYKFNMEFIGSGIMLERMENLIIENGLSDCVKILGPRSTEIVRSKMEEANVFLFTSDFNEGWGAVLNESMNSGCSVIASHAIGSVPFLIKNGVNGLVYKNGNLNEFVSNIKYLLDNPAIQNSIGREAYVTITDVWNSKVAAQRFIELSYGLLTNHNVRFDTGPCSYAEPIKQSRIYEYMNKRTGDI